MKDELEKLIKKWQKSAKNWENHGKAALDWETKNEFYAKSTTFKTCAKELKKVLEKS